MVKRPQIEEVQIEPSQSPDVQKSIIGEESKHSKRGLITGCVFIMVGVLFIILNIAGAVNIRLVVTGLSAQVDKASPGIVVILVGLAIIWLTRLQIKVASKK